MDIRAIFKREVSTVLLAFLAAALQFFAFVVYLRQISRGSSVPNPASWTVWAFLAALNALTFWQATGDALATAPFFIGGTMCTLVFLYSLLYGKFSRLNQQTTVVLIIGLVACAVWYVYKEAMYANLVVAFSFGVSSWSTIRGTIDDPESEAPLPWFIWTLAFVVTTINVILRWKGQWISLLMPIECVVIHAVVALLAMGQSVETSPPLPTKRSFN